VEKQLAQKIQDDHERQPPACDRFGCVRSEGSAIQLNCHFQFLGSVARLVEK